MMPPLKKPVADQVIINDKYFDHNEKLSIHKALVKLLTGTYGSDFEKLSRNLYSMRLEGKGRILLVNAVIKGVRTLILVECLPEHEYVSSTCLHRYRSSGLQAHIARCAQGVMYVVSKKMGVLEPRDKVDVSQRSGMRLLEYGTCYIEANDAQHVALSKKKKTPQDAEVVYGEAGSGKTLVLMQRLSSLAALLATDNSSKRKKIWVLVPHGALHEHLGLEWQNQSVYQEIQANPNLENPVQIVTPDSFYRQLDNIANTVESKDYSDFIHWLSADDLAKMESVFGSLSKMQVYQELCIFNGLIILQGKMKLARKLYKAEELSPAFLDSNDKSKAAEAVADLLQRYQEHLKATNGFDPYVYKSKKPLPQQDYFFADEAQNLPQGLLGMPNAFIAMNDSQSIRFRRRVNELLLKKVYEGKTIEYSELPGTHRSPQQPIHLASRVDTFVAQQVHPKRKQASTSSPLKAVNGAEGLVCFVGDTPDELSALQQAVQEPDTAVVYLTPESEQEFTKLGIKPLCAFTPDNPILGLEFKRVIIVSPLTPLGRHGRTGKELTTNQIAELELYLNNVKAAITRATDTVVVFQKKAHETEGLVAFFQEGVKCSPMQAMNMTEQELQEALYKQACWLYSQGHAEMALGIIEELSRSREDFLREVNPAMATGSSSSSAPANAPGGAPANAPGDAPANAPGDAPANAPGDAPANAPGDAPANAPGDAPDNAPDNVTKPLTKSFHRYVENFLAQVSEVNLKNLLANKRAASMLFHHKMADGQCVFLKLLLSDRSIGLFRTILQQDNTKEKQALVAAMATISEHNYLLRFALSSIGNKHQSAKILSFDLIQEMGLGRLFAEGSSEEQMSIVKYLVRRVYSITEQDLTHQYRHEDGSLAPSLLSLLASDADAWISFFSRNAGQLTILKNALSCQAKKDNTYNIKTVLSLIQTSAGRQWFFNNINVMAPYANEDVLFALLGSPSGSPLITHWMKFKKFLRIESLFAPLIGDGVHKGKSAFHLLCGTSEGCTLLSSHWGDFKKFLSAERLFTPATGDGPDKGKTPFSLLCASVEGCALLIKHWDDFKVHLTIEGLFTLVTGDGVEKGTTPFYWLCAFPEGRAILIKHWKDFKDHLSDEGLFASAEGDGEAKGVTPFSLLCGSIDGLELLTRHWDDFKDHLSVARLFAPTDGEEIYKGATPFFWLCAIPEGRVLLTCHWDDFKDHLSEVGLFAPLTGESIHKGKNPFLMLCGFSDGCALLAKQWDCFKDHLSAARLFAPVIGEGLYKGKTPFHLLCSSPEGIELLTRHWDDFKKHFQVKELFTQVTENKTGKKESSYSLLNATKEGKALLAHISIEFPNEEFRIGSSSLGFFTAPGDEKASAQNLVSAQTQTISNS